MKAKRILHKQHDTLRIPEGAFTEPYTPTTGRIVSPSLNKALAYAKMLFYADATVTYVDYAGNLVTGATFPKGTAPVLVREIRSCDVSVAIVHDGVLAPSEIEMTSPIYNN